jgi:hypothetical protein
MIFCVVPAEMGPELLDQLTTYYEDDPNVEVIADRRASERRTGTIVANGSTPRREIRDRRRSRIPGEFPPLDLPARPADPPR